MKTLRSSNRYVAACALAALAAVSFQSAARADPAIVPAYASNYSLQTLLADPNLLHVDQLAFNPADPAHLYAARTVFPGEGSSSVTRFDYAFNPGTGVTTVSNPFTVATFEPGSGPVGIAFWNGNLVASYSHHVDGSDAIGTYNTDGRLSILRPNLDGTFGSRVDFAYGIFNLYHQIDQIRIAGNTLYVGIGTRDNGGIASVNAPYNGTVGRIADLSQTDFADADHDGLADTNALAGNYTTIAADGQLRRYAGGFRNPFGVLVDNGGNLWVSDNGRDDSATEVVTPDVLYKNLQPGDTGTFPPGNGGTTLPLADLGNHTGVTGLTLLPSGPDAGAALVARYHFVDGVGGADFVLVDPDTGAVSQLAAGFGSPLDTIVDPYGQVLLADFYADSDNGALYLLNTPEPASLAVLLPAAAILLSRRRNRLR